MKETYGVPVEEIQEGIKSRRAQDQHRHRHPSGDDRRDPPFMFQNPSKFDPRDYLKPAREAAKQVVRPASRRSAAKARREDQGVPLEKMAER
jgi:fructose-bisphosphate aldolase class II